MSLNWNWSDKMGSITFDNGHTMNLYQGNALMIGIWEFEDDTYTLGWYAADREHLKNMLGLTKGYNNCIEDMGFKIIRLDTRYKAVPQILNDFAKAKIKVTFELYEGGKT